MFVEPSLALYEAAADRWGMARRWTGWARDRGAGATCRGPAQPSNARCRSSAILATGGCVLASGQSGERRSCGWAISPGTCAARGSAGDRARDRPPRGLATVHLNLGECSPPSSGARTRRARHLEEATALFERSGHQIGLAFALQGLGNLAAEAGDCGCRRLPSAGASRFHRRLNLAAATDRLP